MPSPVPQELDNLISELLGEEKKFFFDMTGERLPDTFRVNTLQCSPEGAVALLEYQGFQLEPLKLFPGCYRPKYEPLPIGRSLAFLLGHIYVQEIASMLPPLVLDPKPGEKVLDMTAAPGSKTTQMAAMMGNRGAIVANDVPLKRIKALSYNLDRLGVINTVVIRLRGEQLGKRYFETFDKVLLDPPCSALGTLHKSPEVLRWWTPRRTQKLVTIQRQLLISAIKAVKPEGSIVYSTCTLTPQENEGVISSVLEKYPVQLEPINLPSLRVRPGLTEFSSQHFSPELRKAIRLYPFDNNTEGFFIAKLRKREPMQPPENAGEGKGQVLEGIRADDALLKPFLEFLREHFGFPMELFQGHRFLLGKEIRVFSAELQGMWLYQPNRVGFKWARPLKKGAKLTTRGVLLFGRWASRHRVELEPAELTRFLRRENLSLQLEGMGQKVVLFKGCPIGYGYYRDGKLKSQMKNIGF